MFYNSRILKTRKMRILEQYTWLHLFSSLVLNALIEFFYVLHNFFIFSSKFNLILFYFREFLFVLLCVLCVCTLYYIHNK